MPQKWAICFAVQGELTGAGPVLTLLSLSSSVLSKTQLFPTQLWRLYLAFDCWDLCAEKTQTRSWHNNRWLKLHLGDIRQVAVWGIPAGMSALSLPTHAKYRPGGGEKRHIGDISEYWPFVCLRFSDSVSVSWGTHTHTHSPDKSCQGDQRSLTLHPLEQQLNYLTELNKGMYNVERHSFLYATQQRGANYDQHWLVFL